MSKLNLEGPFENGLRNYEAAEHLSVKEATLVRWKRQLGWTKKEDKNFYGLMGASCLYELFMMKTWCKLYEDKHNRVQLFLKALKYEKEKCNEEGKRTYSGMEKVFADESINIKEEFKDWLASTVRDVNNKRMRCNEIKLVYDMDRKDLGYKTKAAYEKHLEDSVGCNGIFTDPN